MDVIEKKMEDSLSHSLGQPPDASEHHQHDCPRCEALKDQLRKLSYCLAVAQRLTDVEIL